VKYAIMLTGRQPDTYALRTDGAVFVLVRRVTCLPDGVPPRIPTGAAVRAIPAQAAKEQRDDAKRFVKSADTSTR